MDSCPFPVFVKDLQNKSICISVQPWYSIDFVKLLIQESGGIPVADQVLTSRTHIRSRASLAEIGITRDATLYLSGRLRGGKGGFGSLLRGAGRATMTDNDDACRDLSGRRVRLVNAEKKLQEWADAEKDRQRQKQAAKEERERVKAEQRTEVTQVELEAVRKDQTAALSSVAKALKSSLQQGNKRVAARTLKQAATKKPRYSSGSSDSEDSDSDVNAEEGTEADQHILKEGSRETDSSGISEVVHV